MKTGIRIIAASVALALAAPAAHAVLERTGPVDPKHGFPTWYQDRTGIALEYCAPVNQGELDGGYCLLLPGDLTLPEPPVGPGYFDEHFWWAADAGMTTAQGNRALLVLAAEAAFAADPTPGGQIAFTRIRVRLDAVPVAGTYRFIHPYGEESAYAEAGERIFITDDVGLSCPPGDFSCATTGRIGPFLLPSETPGGNELPPVTGPAPGKLYIADPARSGPVTGSPTGNNKFRVEGPVGSNLGGPGIDFIETSDFTLMGRLFGGQMPGKISGERVNYTNSSSSGKKVDVFLKAEPTGQSRVPGSARPPEVLPVTSFFDKPCQPIFDASGNVTGYSAPAGGSEILMNSSGNNRWGQRVASAEWSTPSSVCVKDNSAVDLAGNPTPAYRDVAVRDEVQITKAHYDPQAKTLTVEASSSDDSWPALTLEGLTATYPLTNGSVVVGDLLAPPEKVSVLSSLRGKSSREVETGFGLASTGGGSAPEAGNDADNTDEDTAVSINVLANDRLDGAPIAAGSATIALVSSPALGSATVNADGTIAYQPNLNANGLDNFSYSVTVNNVVSNIATVSVIVNPKNDSPVASADLVTGAVGVPLVIRPLANDTDVDGNVLSLKDVSAVSGGPVGAITSLVQNPDKSLTFTANLGGTYTFTYFATDGEFDSPATVTITIAAPEALAVTSAEYRSTKSRWRVGGTSNIEADHEVKVILTGNATCVERELGRTTSVAGVYALDTVGTAPGTGCTSVRAESVLGGVTTPFVVRVRN